jgi:hypothetical protein
VGVLGCTISTKVVFFILTNFLGQLRRNFHYRDRHTFLRLYKQYVRPHLEFSAPAWSPWLQGDKDTLEKVQEKAVKMVAGLKGANYLEKCTELGLETLEKRREDQDLALVYKSVVWHQNNIAQPECKAQYRRPVEKNSTCWPTTTTSHERICYPPTWRTGCYSPSNK